MSNFLEKTEVSRRNYGVATLVGVIGGILSGIVKLGTEGPWPPRSPDRLTPPTIMLQNWGIDVNSMTYTFNQTVINYGNWIVHFGFSIVFAVMYCVIAEVYPKIKIWQGIGFAIVIQIVFHIFVLPMMSLTPPLSQIPFDEHLSELIGHIMWFWCIEVVRRDIRNRITGQPDPEVKL